jgi:hypothetical protein
MSLELPRGMYQIKWVDVRTGEVLSREGLRHRSGQLVIKSPGFKDEVALSIKAE